jgi:hypothetical protein
MANIDEQPKIINIGTGEITNTTISMTEKLMNVDVFNGTRKTFDQYVMKMNDQGTKYTIGPYVAREKEFALNDCMLNGTIYLNTPEATKVLGDGNEVVAGTHIGETSISEGLKKEQTLKFDGYDIKTNLDFVYVRMSTGVSSEYGEENYRKSSENVTPATDIKKAAGNMRVGFYHYLTGYAPTDNAKEIGKAQAQHFLKQIVGYDPTDGKINNNLNGTMVPMVVFVDNITEANYYGSAPNGVKKNLENF